MNADPVHRPIVEISERNFDTEVLQSRGPVLVAFWAPWSQPCLRLETVLHEITTACARIVKLVKVNADDHPVLSLWYEVQSIPTLLYFLDGTVRFRTVGTVSKQAILDQLELLARRDPLGPVNDGGGPNPLGAPPTTGDDIESSKS